MAKYYYNEYLLPKLPTNFGTDNAFILQSKSDPTIIEAYSSAYDNPLYVSDGKLYFEVNTYRQCSYDNNNENWCDSNLTYGQVSFSLSSYNILWSKTDILNGSSTSTDIYFNGNYPVPEFANKLCCYNGIHLPAIPIEALYYSDNYFIRIAPWYGNDKYYMLHVGDESWKYGYNSSYASDQGLTNNGQMPDGSLQWIYKIPIINAEYATDWGSYQNYATMYVDVNDDDHKLIWTNKDIIDTATSSVYFAGSEFVECYKSKYEIETEPSCATTGVGISTCICGDIRTETIPAIGHHNYINGICTVCGDIPRVSIDYDIVKGYADEARRLTGYTSKMNAVIVLEKLQNVKSGSSEPNNDLINGTITEFIDADIVNLRNYALAGQQSLSMARLPACIEVGEHAFENCSTLASVSFPNAIKIGNYAFASCFNLSNVYSPEVTDIGASAFRLCSNLSNISFPNLTNIGTAAFYSARNLSNVNFSNVMSIGSQWAFGYCSNLTSVNLPLITNTGAYAFYSCSNLSFINIPECISIGSNAFYKCYSMMSVSLPKCRSIGSNAFYDCKFVDINLPMCQTIGQYAFRSCMNLKSINLPVCTNISTYAFYDCLHIDTVVLGASTVCSLQTSYAFVSPLPYFYVPASLVNSYKADKNWSYYSNRITSIENLV